LRKATIVASDMHFGDQALLWGCLSSTMDKAIARVREFGPDRIEVLLNGDAVAGRGIFRLQSVQNTVQLGAWQVAWAAWEIKRWQERLGADIWRIILGNHDNSVKENLAQQLTVWLRLLEVPVTYADRDVIGNFSAEKHDFRWYHAEHGSGYSSYYANSYSAIRSCWKKFIEVAKIHGIMVSRFMRGHTHWLNVGEGIGVETAIDTTGGWHRQERLVLGSDIRNTGMLLYLADNTELEIETVEPDLEMLVEESKSPTLAFTNMQRAGAGLEHVARWGRSEGLW